MFKYFIIVAGLCLLGLGSQASAAWTCLTNCSSDAHTEITDTLEGNENSVGYTKSSKQVVTPAVTLRSSINGGAMHWLKYRGEPIPEPFRFNVDWQYVKVDDYISVALAVSDPCVNGGRVYAPFNVRDHDTVTCQDAVYSPGGEPYFVPRVYESKIKVTKKIVSGTISKNILVATFGRCQGEGCMSSEYTQNIFLSINITVPQSCELNAGQVINIDFGNISSGAFKTAGAIAQGVQPKSRDISVKCDNIAGNAQLTLRLQADKTNGNIVVSDENNDVGFRVTNNSGTPLIPNNLSSVIPFTLDSNARQNVTIQAYPVSVTGNKPTEGPVTSRGYLRVDFP